MGGGRVHARTQSPWPSRQRTLLRPWLALHLATASRKQRYPMSLPVPSICFRILCLEIPLRAAKYECVFAPAWKQDLLGSSK